MVFNPKTMKPKKNASAAEFAHPRNPGSYSPFATENVDDIINDYQKPKIDKENIKGFDYTGKPLPPGNNQLWECMMLYQVKAFLSPKKHTKSEKKFVNLVIL